MGMIRSVSTSFATATMLVACTGTPTTVTPSASPMGASPAPSGAPATSGPASSVAPESLVAPSADAGSSAVSSPASTVGDTGIIKGQVYDAKGGNAPDGSFVSLKSLDPAQPYSA